MSKTENTMSNKDFFNWLREMQANKRLSQETVDGANELLALTTPEELKASLEKLNNWQEKGKNILHLSEKGLVIIKEFEGFRSNPYLDSVGVATIGYGSTYYENGKEVSMKDPVISEERASELKLNIINQDFAPAVNLMFAEQIAKGEITQNMFDALISLAYNIGTRGLAGSSVARYIKKGDYQKAGNAFLAWNKGRIRGKLVELKGLTIRRNKEREIFLA